MYLFRESLTETDFFTSYSPKRSYPSSRTSAWVKEAVDSWTGRLIGTRKSPASPLLLWLSRLTDMNSEACSFTVRACQSSPIGFLSQRVRRAYGRRRRSIIPVLQRAPPLPLAKEPIGIAARLWTADLLKSFRRILV